MFTDFRKGIAETGWQDDVSSILRKQTEAMLDKIREMIEENREDIVSEKIKDIEIAISINDDRETMLKIPKEYEISVTFYGKDLWQKFGESEHVTFIHSLFTQKIYAYEYGKDEFGSCKKSHFQMWQMLWLASYLPSILKKSRIPCKYLHDEEHLFFIEVMRSARWFLG